MAELVVRMEESKLLPRSIIDSLNTWLNRRKWMDRGVVVGWKGGEQTYLLLECLLDGSRNWSGRERDTDGHTDLGTQLEGTKREATARAVPRPTDHYERNMMNGKDREEKESY
ncbi:hypothetical protein PRIPAC_95832 [Pristionchus pacificus]|uniref:Uncharacterized protein n=1 Tax=Pristionchus pacificus TaxID=54126 RepID=A0A2A6BCX5_PRIPA|nr:hypothetical protein PRIPAC_95832 [Pristionchus pacificus]|eukprot:PDM63733.1 hypothetical protein PRIPAC_49706 [Pristionchus pacificus]